MEEMRCPCGGIFQSLGMEYLRTGAVSDGFLFGRDANAWAEGAIPVEERVQIAMKDYASYSEKRLRKIADGETWSNHCEEEREAARRLLEHRTPQHKKNDVPWEK